MPPKITVELSDQFVQKLAESIASTYGVSVKKPINSSRTTTTNEEQKMDQRSESRELDMRVCTLIMRGLSATEAIEQAQREMSKS